MESGCMQPANGMDRRDRRDSCWALVGLMVTRFFYDPAWPCENDSRRTDEHDDGGGRFGARRAIIQFKTFVYAIDVFCCSSNGTALKPKVCNCTVR